MDCLNLAERFLAFDGLYDVTGSYFEKSLEHSEEMLKYFIETGRFDNLINDEKINVINRTIHCESEMSKYVKLKEDIEREKYSILYLNSINHAFSIGFAKIKDNEYKIFFFNSGDGVSMHPIDLKKNERASYLIKTIDGNKLNKFLDNIEKYYNSEFIQLNLHEIYDIFIGYLFLDETTYENGKYQENPFVYLHDEYMDCINSGKIPDFDIIPFEGQTIGNCTGRALLNQFLPMYMIFDGLDKEKALDKYNIFRKLGIYSLYNKVLENIDSEKRNNQSTFDNNYENNYLNEIIEIINLIKTLDKYYDKNLELNDPGILNFRVILNFIEETHNKIVDYNILDNLVDYNYLNNLKIKIKDDYNEINKYDSKAIIRDSTIDFDFFDGFVIDSFDNYKLFLDKINEILIYLDESIPFTKLLFYINKIKKILYDIYNSINFHIDESFEIDYDTTINIVYLIKEFEEVIFLKNNYNYKLNKDSDETIDASIYYTTIHKLYFMIQFEIYMYYHHIFKIDDTDGSYREIAEMPNIILDDFDSNIKAKRDYYMLLKKSDFINISKKYKDANKIISSMRKEIDFVGTYLISRLGNISIFKETPIDSLKKDREKVNYFIIIIAINCYLLSIKNNSFLEKYKFQSDIPAELFTNIQLFINYLLEINSEGFDIINKKKLKFNLYDSYTIPNLENEKTNIFENQNKCFGYIGSYDFYKIINKNIIHNILNELKKNINYNKENVMDLIINLTVINEKFKLDIFDSLKLVFDLYKFNNYFLESIYSEESEKILINKYLPEFNYNPSYSNIIDKIENFGMYSIGEPQLLYYNIVTHETIRNKINKITNKNFLLLPVVINKFFDVISRNIDKYEDTIIINNELYYMVDKNNIIYKSYKNKNYVINKVIYDTRFYFILKNVKEDELINLIQKIEKIFDKYKIISLFDKYTYFYDHSKKILKSENELIEISLELEIIKYNGNIIYDYTKLVDLPENIKLFIFNHLSFEPILQKVIWKKDKKYYVKLIRYDILFEINEDDNKIYFNEYEIITNFEDKYYLMRWVYGTNNILILKKKNLESYRILIFNNIYDDVNNRIKYFKQKMVWSKLNVQSYIYNKPELLNEIKNNAPEFYIEDNFKYYFVDIDTNFNLLKTDTNNLNNIIVLVYTYIFYNKFNEINNLLNIIENIIFYNEHSENNYLLKIFKRFNDDDNLNSGYKNYILYKICSSGPGQGQLKLKYKNKISFYLKESLNIEKNLQLQIAPINLYRKEVFRDINLYNEEKTQFSKTPINLDNLSYLEKYIIILYSNKDDTYFTKDKLGQEFYDLNKINYDEYTSFEYDKEKNDLDEYTILDYLIIRYSIKYSEYIEKLGIGWESTIYKNISINTYKTTKDYNMIKRQFNFGNEYKKIKYFESQNTNILQDYKDIYSRINEYIEKTQQETIYVDKTSKFYIDLRNSILVEIKNMLNEYSINHIDLEKMLIHNIDSKYEFIYKNLSLNGINDIIILFQELEKLDNTKDQNILKEEIARKFYLMNQVHTGNNCNLIFLFESIFGNMIRQDQIDIVNNIYNQFTVDNENRKFHQLLMGGGKTAVITPLLNLFLIKNHPDKFIINILPESLVNQSYNILVNLLKYVFDINVILKKIDRNTESSKWEFTENTVYIMSDSSYKSLLLNCKTQGVLIYNNILNEIKNNAFVIIDEVDLVNDTQKSELNYPLANKKEDDTKIDENLLILIMNFTIDIINIFNNPNNYETDNEICNYINFTPNFHLLDEKQYESLFKHHMKDLLKVTLKVLDKNSKNIKIKYIVEIIFRDILPVIIKSKNRLNFGIINNNDEKEYNYIAIPFIGLEQPSFNEETKISSEFSNYIIKIFYTYISYTASNSHYFRKNDIRNLLNYLKNDYFKLSKYINDKEEKIIPLYHRLLDLYGIDKSISINNITEEYFDTNVDKFRNKLSSLTYKTAYESILYYYLKKIFNNYLRIKELVYNCSFVDMISSNVSKYTSGFTGTPLFYIPFVNPKEREYKINHNNDDGKIISGMTNKFTKINMYEYNKTEDIFNKLKTKEYTVLIDIGTFFINYKSYKVIKLIKDLLKDTYTNFIYIDEDHVKKYITKDSDTPQIFSENIIPITNRFVYFDSGHITGQDIKIVPTARGLATINIENTYRDVAQGIFRLRRLNYGQEIDFIIHNKICSNILNISDLINLLYFKNLKNNLSKEKIGIIQNLRRELRIKNPDFYKIKIDEFFPNNFSEMKYSLYDFMLKNIIDEGKEYNFESEPLVQFLLERFKILKNDGGYEIQEIKNTNKDEKITENFDEKISTSQKSLVNIFEPTFYSKYNINNNLYFLGNYKPEDNNNICIQVVEKNGKGDIDIYFTNYFDFFKKLWFDKYNKEHVDDVTPRYIVVDNVYNEIIVNTFDKKINSDILKVLSTNYIINSFITNLKFNKFCFIYEFLKLTFNNQLFNKLFDFEMLFNNSINTEFFYNKHFTTEYEKVYNIFNEKLSSLTNNETNYYFIKNILELSLRFIKFENLEKSFTKLIKFIKEINSDNFVIKKEEYIKDDNDLYLLRNFYNFKISNNYQDLNYNELLCNQELIYPILDYFNKHSEILSLYTEINSDNTLCLPYSNVDTPKKFILNNKQFNELLNNTSSEKLLLIFHHFDIIINDFSLLDIYNYINNELYNPKVCELILFNPKFNKSIEIYNDKDLLKNILNTILIKTNVNDMLIYNNNNVKNLYYTTNNISIINDLVSNIDSYTINYTENLISFSYFDNNYDIFIKLFDKNISQSIFIILFNFINYYSMKLTIIKTKKVLDNHKLLFEKIYKKYPEYFKAIYDNHSQFKNDSIDVSYTSPSDIIKKVINTINDLDLSHIPSIELDIKKIKDKLELYNYLNANPIFLKSFKKYFNKEFEKLNIIQKPTFDGGYYNKYLKYKTKYLKYKKLMNNK